MSEIERVIEKKEYIERGALSERAEIIRKKMITEKHEPFTIDIMNDFADFLDQYAKDIPAADVEPVVRGEWVEGEHVGTDEIGVKHSTKYYICSECGFVSYSIIERCHGCFAHMERSGSSE